MLKKTEELPKETEEHGLFALYRRDPDEADKLLFGRETYPDRRGFLKGAGLATMGAMVGATIPFHRNIPPTSFPSRWPEKTRSKARTV